MLREETNCLFLNQKSSQAIIRPTDMAFIMQVYCGGVRVGVNVHPHDDICFDDLAINSLM